MAAPVLKVESSLTTLPFAAPSWVDQTSRVRSFTVQRGRRKELESFPTGTMTLTLDNSARTFDPLVDSNVRPNRRWRARCEWGTVLRGTGASGAYAWTADAASLDITGDIGVAIRIKAADTTPASAQTLCGKWTTTGNQRSYRLVLNTDGTLTWWWSTNGTAESSAVSTASIAAAPDGWLWVYVTHDVNPGTVTFYTAEDPTWDYTRVRWHRLGTAVSSGVTSIYSSTARFELMGHTLGVSERFIGDISAAAVENGIGGTAATHVCFEDGDEWAAGDTTGVDRAGTKTYTVAGAATTVARSWPLFSGFSDGYPQSYDRGNTDATVSLTCSDGSKMLGRANLPGGPLDKIISGLAPVHWWKLGEAEDSETFLDHGSAHVDGEAPNAAAAAGFGGAGLDGATDETCWDPATGEYLTTGRPPVTTWDTFSCLVSSVVVESGGAVETTQALYAGPEGGVFLWSSDATGPVYVAGWKPGDTSWVRATAGRIDTGASHSVVARRAGNSDWVIYVDGVLVADTTFTPVAPATTAPVQQFIGGRPDHSAHNTRLAQVALYATDVTSYASALHQAAQAWTGDTTGTRIGHLLDVASWPTADRDLDTGATDVSGNGLTGQVQPAVNKTAESEQGAFFFRGDGWATFQDRHRHLTQGTARNSQATYTDAGSGVGYTAGSLAFSYGEDEITNIFTGTRDGGTPVTAKDQTSIAEFGDLADSATGLLNLTDEEVRSLCEWRVGLYSQPSLRADAITVRPAGETGGWLATLGREIGDRVTVVRRPQNTGSTITLATIIESVRWDKGLADNDWRLTLGLSPALTREGFVLDDTTYGRLDHGHLAF